MPRPQPRRTPPASLLFIPLLTLVALAGCSSGGDLSSRLDEASLARLEALPAEGSVLAACRFDAAPDELPAMGAGVRELGRTASAVLVELPRAELGRLAGMDGATSVAVWGDATTTSKIDPQLRAQLLEAWSTENTAELEMIATFDENGIKGVRERLEAAGARPRTVAGPVVTVDAAPGVVLEILAMPGLVRLQKPRQLKLLDGQ